MKQLCPFGYTLPMNIAKLPSSPPTLTGYCLDPRQPVLARALEIQGAHRVVSHRHPRAQLVYAIHGVLRVRSIDGTWIVPPSQAVWVPPEVEHEVITTDTVSIRTLFIDPSATAGLPQRCCVLNVPSLLRELIVKAVEIGDGYQDTDSDFRMMLVILDRLREAEPAPLHLPMGRDPRLRKVMEALHADPADGRSIADWARVGGASPRTLARLFVRETGMTFGDWRRRLRLLEAIDRLERGFSVTRVALELGYQSPSAFVAMFHHQLGAPPAAYCRRGGE